MDHHARQAFEVEVVLRPTVYLNITKPVKREPRFVSDQIATEDDLVLSFGRSQRPSPQFAVFEDYGVAQYDLRTVWT